MQYFFTLVVMLPRKKFICHVLFRKNFSVCIWNININPTFYCMLENQINNTDIFCGRHRNSILKIPTENNLKIRYYKLHFWWWWLFFNPISSSVNKKISIIGLMVELSVYILYVESINHTKNVISWIIKMSVLLFFPSNTVASVVSVEEVSENNKNNGLLIRNTQTKKELDHMGIMRNLM